MRSLTIDDGIWYVGNQSRSPDYGELVLHIDELVEVTVGELEALFREVALTIQPSAGVFTGKASDLDPELVGIAQVGFMLRHGLLVPVVEFGLPWPEDERENERTFDDREAVVQHLIAPLIARSGSAVLEFLSDPYGYNIPDLGPGQYPCRIVLEAPAGAVTVRDLYELGDDVVRLIDAFFGDAPTRGTVADLIRGGRSDLLVGLPESGWLDVKSQEYGEPKNQLASYNAAVDVTAFCNAEDGGIIVIGGSTDGGKNENGGEIITTVDGLHEVRKKPSAYLASLRELVFPMPAEIRIEVIELQSGNPIILIDIPPQPDEQKPFLVRRALGVCDGKVETGGFTIAQRRGEHNVQVDAASLHGQIAAGRALLKRGVIPDGGR